MTAKMIGGRMLMTAKRETMRTVRCSALPALMLCGPSQDADPLLIEQANPEATMGSAVHAGAAMIVQGLDFDEVALAMRFGVNLEQLRIFLAVVRKVWRELAPAFPNPQVESSVACVAIIEMLALTGHVDVLSLIGEQHSKGSHARLLDWKTGRKEETNYYPQMIGYAACLILGEDGTETVTTTVVWLRSQQVETYTITRKDVDAFFGMLESHLAEHRYRTGEHCGNCPRSHSCEALIAQSRRDLAIFRDDELMIELETMGDGKIVELRRSARTLVKFAESMDQAIRRIVEKHGPLESFDGYRLEFVEENGKRELDTLKTWDIAAAKLDDSEMAGCLTFSASDLDDAIAKKAGRGKGKAAKEALRAELEAAGAITQPKIKKLREVRLPMALPAKGESR